MLKVNRYLLAPLLLTLAVVASLFIVNTVSALEVTVQYTDAKKSSISVKGSIFGKNPAAGGTFYKNSRSDIGLGTVTYVSDKMQIDEGRPHSERCTFEIQTAKNNAYSGTLVLKECGTRVSDANKKEIEKLFGTGYVQGGDKEIKVAIAKSNEELRNEELSRDKAAYTDALRKSTDVTAAFCDYMSDKSECANDLGAYFSQCFDGYVRSDDFTYPEYNIDFLSGCLAGKPTKYDASKKPIYYAALQTVDESVRTNNEEKPVVSGDEKKEEATDDPVSTCAIPAIGWLICPVLTFTGSVVDAAYGFVSALLVFQPLTVTDSTGGQSGIYSAWVVMRNIANVAFIIAFLIIIFSQLTGQGVSNYGVKKMLPRLLIAAILINASFWICAIAVDLSNIIGASMRSIFESVGANINFADETKNAFGATTDNAVWSDIVKLVLTGVAGAAALYIGLSALFPAIIAVVFAIVAVFLVLVLRQALIVMLIVAAPLAFVAFLLPNTNGLFDKWRKLFMTMLLMYPIIAALFGLSALASKVVMVGASGDFSIVVQIVGATIAVLPLALTPLVMKTAGGVLNRIGGVVNDKNRGPFDRAKKSAEDYRKRQEQRRGVRALNGSGRSFARGKYRRASQKKALESSLSAEMGRAETTYNAKQAEGSAGFANRLAGGSSFKQADENAVNRALAGAINVQAKLDADEVTAAKAVISHAELSGAERQTLAMNGSVTKNGRTYSSETLQRAAIQEQVSKGSIGEVHQIVAASGSGLSKFKSDIASTIATSGLGAKDPSLVGKTIDDIAQGKIASEADLNNARVKAVLSGKVTAESVVSMDNDARDKIYMAVKNSTAPEAAEAVAQVKSAARAVVATPELRNKVAGNKSAERAVAAMTSFQRDI